MGCGSLTWSNWGDIPRPGSTFFDFGGLFIDKSVRSSASCDGS